MKHKQTLDEWDQKTKEMHKVFHSFQKEFWDENRNWKLDTDDLIEAIERWAKKQEPGNVDFCSCDDSYHMSSDLVMIHHIWTDQEKKKNWWGTTVILITQDGQAPAEFFLYPGHAKGLIDCLSKLYKIKEQRYVEG